MKPIISIIVPVYNVEPYIKDCIESILLQEFSNFELVLINDGSSDNSGAICDEYSQRDQRIKILHKEYGGVSSARNIGVSIAQGEFIGFVDGDDRIDKSMFKELYRLCLETNSDIAICKLGREIDGEIINSEEEEFIKVMDNNEAMKELFKGNLYRFSLCNKLFKISCFKNVYFPEGRIHEDLATTYKLFSNSNKAVYTSFLGYIYVKRKDSILTSKFNKKRLDAFLGWEEIIVFMDSRYPYLSNEFLCCFAYGSVDNIHYILNQVESTDEKKTYLELIKQVVRKYFRKLTFSTTLSFKYKLTLALLIFSTNILILSDKTKKLRLGF